MSGDVIEYAAVMVTAAVTITYCYRSDSAFCFSIVHGNGTETETANEGNDHLLADVSGVLRLFAGVFPRPSARGFNTDSEV